MDGINGLQQKRTKIFPMEVIPFLNWARLQRFGINPPPPLVKESVHSHAQTLHQSTLGALVIDESVPADSVVAFQFHHVVEGKKKKKENSVRGFRNVKCQLCSFL